MDSKLLIGPGIPTPDPTARAPLNISYISPHRLMELTPVATAVSIHPRATAFCFVLFCYWLLGGIPRGVTGELPRAAATRNRCKIRSRAAKLPTSGKTAKKLSGSRLQLIISSLRQVIHKI